MSKRRIIIIGAGFLQVPAIEIAKEMGLYTIVADYNKDAYGMKIADLPLIISTRDVDGSVRAARDLSKKMKIDGVITVGTDASITVAAVANALGLPGNRFEDAYAATNKIRMRERLKKFNVPQPNFFPAWSYDDAIDAFNKLSHPVVIKPADNMGSRGVMKIIDKSEIKEGFSRAKSSSPSGEVIIEEYMEGAELSIDMLIYEDNIYVTGVADRVIEHPPYFIETGHIMPSNLPSKDTNDAIEVMKKGIRALNLCTGAAKGDIKITKNGAMVGEIAARLSGGFMSAYTYPLSTGVNLIRNAIDIALGDPPSDLKPKWNKVAVEKAFLPGSGIVDSIIGIDEALRIDGVKKIYIKTHVGDVLMPPTNNLEKAGNVITVADSRDKAIEIANKAIDTVHFNLQNESKINVSEIKKAALEKLKLKKDAYEFFNQDLDHITGLSNYHFEPNLIREAKDIKLSTSLFGTHVSQPIIIDSIHKMGAMLNGVMDIKEYYKSIIDASCESEIVSIFREFENDGDLNVILDIIKDTQRGIVMFSASYSEDVLINKLKKAEDSGAIALGIDFIDSRNNLNTKTEKELARLVKSVGVPFIVSGITSEIDLEYVLNAGVSNIYIKNDIRFLFKRGPLVSDSIRRVLLFLKRHKKNINVLVESHSVGEDALTYFALGANIVSITADMFLATLGYGNNGIKYMVNLNNDEFRSIMRVLGASTLDEVKASLVESRRIWL